MTNPPDYRPAPGDPEPDPELIDPAGSVVDPAENAIEMKQVEGKSQGQIVFGRFIRHKAAVISSVVLLLIALLAFSSIGFSFFGLQVPGWWLWAHTDQPPITNAGRPTMVLPWDGGFALGEHPFGQDSIGRDIFARTMQGTQTSLMIMLVVGGLSLLIGTVVGALSGFYRGWVDTVLMRFTDLVITLPTIAIGAVLGLIVRSPSPFLLGIMLGLITWTTMARLVRGDFLSLREREFVDAARVAGASSARIIFVHILPNAVGIIVVNTTLVMASAVLLETALSYLGFGVLPPNVSLGRMISDYQNAFNTRPWLFWWPGAAIILIALAVNFIGDGLRDAFDPRQRRLPSRRSMDRAQRAKAKDSHV